MLEYLSKLLGYLEYYNKMAPFPVYDTEYVGAVRNKIKELEDQKEDYDSLPVAACKYCKNLYIEVDELDNNHCMRCGSINDLIIYENIEIYLKKTRKFYDLD